MLSDSCPTCGATYRCDQDEDGAPEIPGTECAAPSCHEWICPSCAAYECDGCGHRLCESHYAAVLDGELYCPSCLAIVVACLIDGAFREGNHSPTHSGSATGDQEIADHERAQWAALLLAAGVTTQEAAGH